MHPFRPTICLTALALLWPAAHAETVAVAVAANFTAPMKTIAAQFAQDTGHTAELSFGSTGKLYAQIRNGAPFGVLLSADDTTPAKLAAEGYAQANTRWTYAVGRLVLWSAQPGYVDAQGEVLRSGQWQHLAVANPKLAPYGQAAMQTLDKLGLTAAATPKLVQGESIGQAYQFAASGNAQLGFVALSQVMQDGRITAGSAWVVPSDLHNPLRQEGIVLQNGANNAAAAALVQYLQGEKARGTMAAYGYTHDSQDNQGK